MEEYMGYPLTEEDRRAEQDLEYLLDVAYKQCEAIGPKRTKYTIFYRTDLSSDQYPRRRVYKIRTDEQSHSRAKGLILDTLNEQNLISKEEYNISCKKDPSWANAIRPYYIFDYDEDLDCFWYTEVYPYDD